MKVELSTDDASLIVLSGKLSDKETIREIPGSYWRRDIRSWTLPCSWSSCLTLRATFKEELEIGPRLLTWATLYRSDIVAPGLEYRNTLKSPADPDVPAHKDLFDHQVVDVEFLSTVRKALLANTMGTGKTASAIRSLQRIQEQGGEVFPALVVCPASVKANWKREFARWMPDARVEVVTGSIIKRRKTLARDDVDVFVTNYEALRSHSRLAPYGSTALARCPDCGGEDSNVALARCQVHEKELNTIEFKSVVFDEAHKTKNAASLQSRAALAAAPEATIRFLLTGTPITSNLIDFYGLLHLLDPEEWRTKIKWVDRFLNTLKDIWGAYVSIDLRPDRLEEFQGALDYRMRRVLLEDVYEGLPDVIEERRDVVMSPKQAKAYRSMADNLIASLDGDELLVAPSPMVAALRLLQLASSYGEIHPGETEDSPDKFILTAPSSKLDAFLNDITDYEGRSTIVFAVSRQLVELLSERMTNYKPPGARKPQPIPHGKIHGEISEEGRDLAVQNFQAGHTKFILCTIGSGGVGLNLQAANTVVYLQRSWSLAEMRQSMGRALRIGSEIHDHITRIDYVTENSLESRVFDVLDQKDEDFETLVRDRERFREILRG